MVMINPLAAFAPYIAIAQICENKCNTLCDFLAPEYSSITLLMLYGIYMLKF